MKPASLPAVADLKSLQDPTQQILAGCRSAATWLAKAPDRETIESIAEFRARAEGICAYATKQRQLGAEAVLVATETLRRSERCMGIAIRIAQEKGLVRKHGKVDVRIPDISQVTGIARQTLSEGFYPMADDVTDGDFDAAINEARAEGNLSRANVVRKVQEIVNARPKPKSEPKSAPKKRAKPNGKADQWKQLAAMAAQGYTSSQIAKKLGIGQAWVNRKAAMLGIKIHADQVVGRSRRLDPNRVLREFAGMLDALVPSCETIEPSRIDRKVLAQSITSMDEAIKAFGTLRKRLKKEYENGR
jgi:hypothetical protein